MVPLNQGTEGVLFYAAAVKWTRGPVNECRFGEVLGWEVVVGEGGGVTFGAATGTVDWRSGGEGIEGDGEIVRHGDGDCLCFGISNDVLL